MQGNTFLWTFSKTFKIRSLFVMKLDEKTNFILPFLSMLFPVFAHVMDTVRTTVISIQKYPINWTVTL